MTPEATLNPTRMSGCLTCFIPAFNIPVAQNIAEQSATLFYIAGNWTHLFLDGRRVSFDRRDGAVRLFPDEDFRFIASHHIGQAEGSGRNWTATALDGETAQLTGRKAAAEWLIKRSEHHVAQLDARAAERRRAKDAAVADALAIIPRVLPGYAAPHRMLGEAAAPLFFVFEPSETRDLLRAVIGLGSAGGPE